MTPKDELDRSRLAEDRHLEVLRAISAVTVKLDAVEALVLKAAETVVKPEVRQIEAKVFPDKG